MQKGTNVQDMSTVLCDAHESGIRNHCYIIVGFPTETEAEVSDTMSFLEAHKGLISQVHRGTFTLDNESPIAHNPEAFGIRKKWERAQSLVPRSLGYETVSGLSQEEATRIFSSVLPFLREFNPYSRALGSYRDHALLIYSKRNEDLDMNGRSFPKWRP